MPFSYYDIVFWLLIVLIALLAFGIETGVATRHRNAVLSSIFSALMAAILMMFFLEDKTSFDFDMPGGKKQAASKKRGTWSNGNTKEESEEEVDDSDDFDKNRKSRTDIVTTEGGFKDCTACPPVVAIRAGTARIGSPDGEPMRRANEGPQRTINLKPFGITRTEITRAQFASFIKASGHQPAQTCVIGGKQVLGATWEFPGFEQSDTHPVVCISLADAEAYANWLTKEAKQTYRLPTEAEWEYVARADVAAAFSTGAEITPVQARFSTKGIAPGAAPKNLPPGPAPTGYAPANPFNVIDMHGNVAELTADCWTSNHAKMPTDGRAVAMFNCRQSVIKGGHWASPAHRLRSAARSPFPVGRAANTVGIRLVRD